MATPTSKKNKMRYFLELSYNGTRFHGWQIQPGAVSVQGTIEQALSTILRNPTPIVGAGRTDTGVHARQMFAHVDIENLPCDVPRFLHSLNSLTGPDIAIHAIHPVHPDAHARFDALSRTYRYFVHNLKDPFLQGLSVRLGPLDYDAMNRAAARLLLTDDFTSFAKLHADNKTNICRVTHARWERLDDNRHVFTITADRFLRNMVRAVVGTLVEVGRGKISEEDFNRIILTRDRCAAGTSMPPEGLFLYQISYPYF